MAGRYEFFDHTADVGVRVFAPTLPELVQAAGDGLYAVVGRLAAARESPGRWLNFEFPGGKATLGARSSLSFEQAPWQAGLTDDRKKRADSQLAMIGDRDRDGGKLRAPLHDDMTAAAPHFHEPVFCQDAANLRSGEDAEPTQRGPRWA